MHSMLQVFHLLPCNVCFKSWLPHGVTLPGKNGRQITKMVSYCAYHRAPNPDTVLIIQTPLGVFSAKTPVQNTKRAGSRLISAKRGKFGELPTVEMTEDEPYSAARCRVFKRVNNNKKRTEEDAIAHRVMRPCHNPLSTIQCLNAVQGTASPLARKFLHIFSSVIFKSLD